jgi:hypothetical protein
VAASATLLGDRCAVLQRKQFGMVVHLGRGSCRSGRLGLGLAPHGAGQAEAGMAVSERRCCCAPVSAPLRLRNGAFGRSHRGIGLVLVGTGQIPSLQALAHVGRDAANVFELAARGFQLRVCPLPGPPGFRTAAAMRSWAAVVRLSTARPSASASAWLRPRSPGSHSGMATPTVFPRAEVSVQAVRLGRQLHGDRFGRPRLGGLR